MKDAELKKCFDSATSFFVSNLDKVSDRDKLIFYGYFKVVSDGPMSGGLLSFFTLDPRKKAWKNAGNISKRTAMNEYVEYLQRLDIGWTIANHEEYLPATKVPSTLGKRSDTATTKLDDFVDTIRRGDEETFFQIATNSPDLLDQTDSTGGTPLHWAADSNQNGMIKIFLSLRFEIDAKDNLGQTPLLIAATCDNYRAMRELLHNGASLDIADNTGETTRDLMQENAELRRCCELYIPYMAD